MMGPDLFEYRTAKSSKVFPTSDKKYESGELVGNQGVNTLNIRKTRTFSNPILKQN